MSIKSLSIETVFPGGIHLLWLTLLALDILGKSPYDFFKQVLKIDAGTMVLLIAVLFSVSFFLGRISEGCISGLIYLKKKDKRQKFVEDFVKNSNPGNVWANKMFALSSSIGIIILVMILLTQVDKSNEIYATVVIGSILIIGAVITFLYWLNFGRRLHHKNNKID
jgi:hypothetical protein